jgi:hypothetical protein
MRNNDEIEIEEIRGGHGYLHPSPTSESATSGASDFYVEKTRSEPAMKQILAAFIFIAAIITLYSGHSRLSLGLLMASVIFATWNY